MSVAKTVELNAASTQGFEDAIRMGVERATKTLEDVKEAWVEDQKVVVENGKIAEYRVRLKVTFVLKD